MFNKQQAKWVSWDIKGPEGWVSGSVPNYGLVLKKANELENLPNTAQLQSTIYKDNPGVWPRLDITYYIQPARTSCSKRLAHK